MDTEPNVPVTTLVAPAQISLLNYPNVATMWACNVCRDKIPPAKETTKSDIRGILNENYIVPSIGTHFHTLVQLVFYEINWNFVEKFYRTEICKDST